MKSMKGVVYEGGSYAWSFWMDERIWYASFEICGSALRTLNSMKSPSELLRPVAMR